MTGAAGGRRRLVLFDVDGTLLWGASPAHVDAFAGALAERYGPGVDPFERGEGDLITCGGRTLGGRLDAEIARWCLTAAGIPDERHDAELPGYCEAIEGWYARAAVGDTGAYVLPGVVDALERLRAAGAPCGVVTGNLEPIARRKLDATGLLPFFARGDTVVGGFGAPPARARAELFAAAEARALAAGDSFSGAVYVGDTPLDAAAAAAAGVPFVGVATGRYSVADLTAAAGPGVPVFADLTEPGALDALLS